MKSFNILILLVLISSLFPFQASADNADSDANIQVERVQEGGGYFNPVVTQTQSDPLEYKYDSVSIQDIKLNIDKYPLNVATKTGDSVLVTATDADIIATPHTLSASGWVQVDYKSKLFSGPSEVSFGFSGVDQAQIVKSETYETYQHTLTRQVSVVKTSVFKPTIVSVKPAVLSTSKSLAVEIADLAKLSGLKGSDIVVLDKTDTDMFLNSKYAQIVYEKSTPIANITVISTINLAYDTINIDGGYVYKYNGEDTETYYQTYPDWKPSVSNKRVEIKTLAGASKWDTQPSGTIAKDTWYSTRFWVDIPFKGRESVSGKYNIAIKQAGADLSSAVILDPWYNVSWAYKKSIGVNSTTNQTDYQIKLNVHYGAGVDSVASSIIHTPSASVADFDDLRFTQSDEATLLSYWIESKTDSTSAVVWVNVNSISSANTTVIYMYYGNVAASTLSNGPGTFGNGRFDNFEWGSDGDNINTSGGNVTWTEASPHAHVSTEQEYTGISADTRSMKIVGGSIVDARFPVTASSTNALYVRLYKETLANQTFFMLHGDGAHIIYVYCEADEVISWFNGTWFNGLAHPTGVSITADAWNTIEVRNISFTSANFSLYVNDALVGTAGMYTGTDYNKQWGFYGGDAAGVDYWIDNAIVRKYASREPIWGSFGTEEVGVPAAPTAVSATDGTDITKVVVTWTKSTGASGYIVTRDGVEISGLLGDVATYDDAGANAGTITVGSITATDGTSSQNVTLSISGASSNHGTTHSYKVKANNSGGNSTDSAADTGYRDIGPLLYQWMRSAAASNAAYSNISGATTASYSDVAAPSPAIVTGTASATDGTSSTVVTLSVAGDSSTVGDTRYYICALSAVGAALANTTANDGYRGTTSLTYQWDRSSADADGAYSAILGGTTDPYNDVGGASSPGGRYYHAVVSMLGAVSSNTTSDRGYMGVPASVTTSTASSVASTTATVGGSITSLNSGPDATEVGVDYGIATGAYTANNHTHGTYGVAAFPINISSLSEGTLYYYKAYAYTVTGFGYGSELTFLTQPLLPTSFVCTTINTTTIALNWVKGTGAGYTYIVRKIGSYPLNIADGTLVYNGTLSTYMAGGLIDATNYYFTAWGYDIEGGLQQYSSATANCWSVTGLPPVVVTQSPSSVLTTSAVLSGNVTDASGNVELVGVNYGTTNAYGSTLTSVVGLPVPAPKSFSIIVAPLSPGVYYYYRAFATNYVGTGYGGEGHVLTKPEPPTFITASFINTTAIQLTWGVGSGAGYTVIRSNTTSYSTDPASGTAVCNVTSPTSSYIIGGLSSLSTYYYTAWSWASYNGTSQYSDTYVQDAETVPSGTPNVYTNASTGYGNDWGTVSGYVTTTYPNPTVFGFQYGVSPAALTSWSNTTAVVSGGVFSSTISGLTSGVTYYYKAFAVNTYGIGYGAVMSFSTGAGIGGGGTLYEAYTYGCGTIWNTVYENDDSGIATNWTTNLIGVNSTSLLIGYNSTPVFGTSWAAQSFTTTTAHSVNQVKLWMSRTSTASAGYVYVGIRDCTSDNVTAPDLAVGLYAIGYISTSGGPIEVSLENEIQLESGKKYAFVVRAPAADTTNYVSILSSNITGGSIYAGGNAIRSISGGAAWVSYSAYDFYFSIIGKPQPIYGNVQAAQTFLVGATPHTAQRVRLILGRVGQPGNIYVSIRNYTSGVLSTVDLASVALNGNAITLDKAMYDCLLVPDKSLEANKSYAVVVTAPSGDRYNYVLWCADAGSGYAGGTALTSQDAGISWTVVAADYMFEVWGNSVLAVLNAKVFKNYLTDGDWLITTEVLNISPPYYDKNEDPSAFYIVSFMGLLGTTYAASPCALWEKSPVSIYLNPTQAASLSWGGNYKIRIGDLPSTIYAEYALISTDWNAASLTYLDNWARLSAKDMEAYKTVKTGVATTYLTYVANKGYVLNQEGGAIFNQACPKLSYVRPNLFQVTSNQPTTTDTTTIATPGATKATTYREVLGDYIADNLDKISASIGISDPKIAGGLIMLAIYFIIAFGTVMKGYAWAGILAAFPVIILGVYYGLLDVQGYLVLLVILVVLFVREFWWKGG